MLQTGQADMIELALKLATTQNYLEGLYQEVHDLAELLPYSNQTKAFYLKKLYSSTKFSASFKDLKTIPTSISLLIQLEEYHFLIID